MTYRSSSTQASLPLEVADAILDHVDAHRDLISLACSSKTCFSLVVPRHTEYRTIRLSSKHPKVWKHLAHRADLARNVRVLLMDESPQRLSTSCNLERYPTTLIPEDVDQSVSREAVAISEGSRAEHMVQAVRNMDSLQKFIWVHPDESAAYHCAILEALISHRSLKDLKIIGSAAPSHFENSPLWRISDLETLHLEGHSWCEPRHHTHMTVMLAQSPMLQSLTLSTAVDCPKFWLCRFPQLRHLSLMGNSFSRGCSDEPILSFLNAHPSIDDLTWHPLNSESQLALGSLPNIRRLHTNNDFALSILEDPTKRSLECISRVFANPSTLTALRRAGGQSMRELHVGQYDTLASIHRLAEIFPALRVLKITKFGPTVRTGRHSQCNLDDYIETMCRFPLLESLPDLTLWETIENMDEKGKQIYVARLAQACPKLKTLGHWDKSLKSVVDVVLVRGVAGDISWERQPQLLRLPA